MKRLNIAQLEELSKKYLRISEEELMNFYGGGETYRFDSKGNLTIEQNDFDYNMVFAGNSSYIYDGTLTLSSYVSNGVSGHTINGANLGLFKFLADNTNVEWGALYEGKLDSDNSTECLLQTSHQKDSLNMMYDTTSGYTSFIHNHPSSYPNYSETDEDTWEYMYNNYYITNYGIYVNGKINDFSDDVANDNL